MNICKFYVVAFGNFIKIRNKTYLFFEEPLNSYWGRFVKCPSICSSSHIPWDKGYYALWELNLEKLYLLDFLTENNFITRVSYCFEDYFGKKNEPFFAEWYSGKINVMDGKIIKSNNHHFPDRHEYLFTIKFKHGILDDTGMSDK